MRLVLGSLLMLLHFLSTYKHQMNQLKTVLEQTESRLQSVDLQLEVEKRKTKTFESHIEYLKERVVTLETQLEKAEEVLSYELNNKSISIKVLVREKKSATEKKKEPQKLFLTKLNTKPH
jgi:septal ring factor EnvC (AmiA/AmiB activator)